jgi:hypothetical protein
MAAFGDLIDHVIPVALGGATTLANLLAAMRRL